jgi:two-component system, NarL family, nitrate/nitrite response regulator NarL
MELLSHRYGFSVVGAVGKVEDLIDVIREHAPNLLIIDMRMTPLDGLKVLEVVRKEGFIMPAVILTMSDSEVDLGNALRAGVRGYLLKDMDPEDVVNSILRVAAGELVVAPSMMIKMIDILQFGQQEQDTKNSLKLLTDREREILQLLARGESNKVIARTLEISHDTVKQHVRHIFSKLNLTSRVEAAVLFAVDQNETQNRST